MARVIANRMTADVDGDFVVFLIGMRINKPWKIHKWLPVFLAMPKMIRELEQRPESGFLGHIFGMKVIVQYWRSFDHLRPTRAARTPCTGRRGWRSTSAPATAGAMSVSGTRRISAAPGEYEAVYSGMPPHGLGTIGKLVPVSARKESARERFAARDAV